MLFTTSSNYYDSHAPLCYYFYDNGLLLLLLRLLLLMAGYVSKDHDAVDVGLGEYVQKDSVPTWLAAYRLLSKSTPCIPEVAIKMAHLSALDLQIDAWSGSRGFVVY